MKRSNVVYLGACAIAMLFVESAFAAEGGIETVVVTAEKRAENIQNVPIAIQAFTAKSIEELGIKASTDLSQFAPNVDIALVAGNGNQPIITIRGVGLNDYDTNNAGPNGIYTDEVYQSSPASQTFQAFDLDRIEILKGPQGTLYGRNTSGGAINFISAKPSDEFQANFHGEFGSYNTYQLEGAIGGQLTDGLDARVAVVKNGSGGYTRNALTGNHENGANNIAGRAQLQWQPNEDLTLLLNFHGATVANRPAEYRHLGSLDATFSPCSVADTLGGTGGCTDIFGYGTPANFYDGAYNRQQHLDVHAWGTSLRGDLRWDDIDLTSISAYEHIDKLHPEDSDASPNRLLEIDFGVRSNTFTQELRATQSTDRYNWVFGLYYLDEDLNQNQPLYILLDADNFFGGPGSGDGIAQIAYDQSQQVTDSFAVFGQGDYKITDEATLTLGGRFTSESKSFRYAGANQFQSGGMDNFGPIIPIVPLPGDSFSKKLSNTSFNWRAAFDYHFSDDVHAYASVASGFKSGGFNGSFIGPSGDPLQVEAQLQPIKPEQVIAYEVGLKSSFFDNRLLFNASVFYNDYRKLQVFVLTPIAPLLAINVLTNAKKAHMEGADIEVIGKPLDSLTLSAQLGFLDTRIDLSGEGFLDKELPLAPHFTLSTLADYKVPLGSGNVDFQFTAAYKSHQFFDLANSPYLTQNAFWIENARVAYSFSDDKWEVAAFVRNLSGQKYFLDVFDLSFIGFYQGIFGAPQTVGVEVNMHT